MGPKTTILMCRFLHITLFCTIKINNYQIILKENYIELKISSMIILLFFVVIWGSNLFKDDREKKSLKYSNMFLNSIFHIVWVLSILYEIVYSNNLNATVTEIVIYLVFTLFHFLLLRDMKNYYKNKYGSG